MLYSEFISKASELTIQEADNGLFYLEPTWKNILYENNLLVKQISDYKVDLNDIKEYLELEVKKRNTEHSFTPYIVNWLFDVISSKLEPITMQEETELVSKVIDFMKTNREENTINKD